MSARISVMCFFGVAAFLVATAGLCHAQAIDSTGHADEFGPNVRAYLQYLTDEEEVVDDRASRHEIPRDYYLRNMNRIRALRGVALRLARASGNDYLPELEAVTADELHTIFAVPPRLTRVKPGQIFNNTFRFLERVRSSEVFFVFARLDPYEQAELIEREQKAKSADGLAGSNGNDPAATPVERESP